ncbi:MAG: ParB/RepB/Spo0J family partition protein, partial [Halobacteriota archaeon]
MTRMVPLNKIKDNPWRDRVRNPIDADRVEAIAVSIGKTKYWMGTYGREMPDGTVQLAFGHHRYEAAKEQGLKEIPIIIEAFTDGEMLVWMAQENVRGELPVVLESVYAAVKALGEGKIEVEALGPKTKTSAIRFAPSFIMGKKGSSTTVVDHPYTADSIARFLGYVKKSSNSAKNSVVAALGILETAERAGLEGGETGTKKAAAVERSLAKLPVNEAVKAVSDIKQREVIIAERQVEVKKANEADAMRMRELQAQVKAREDAAEAVRQVELDKLKAAREAEDKK